MNIPAYPSHTLYDRLYSSEPFFSEDFSNSYNEGVAWAKERVLRYSETACTAMYVPLNLIFLIGKATDYIPPIITKGSLVSLSFIGMISLPTQFDYGVKYVGDFKAAFRRDMRFLALCTGLRALETFANIGLTVVACGAALLGLAGFAALQATLYTYMMPIATGVLVVSFVLMFVYILLNKRALNELNQQTIFELTPLIRAMMDKDTLKVVIDRLALVEENNQEEVQNIIRQNLESQLMFVQGMDFGLAIIGYPLMAVQKYYTPNSIVSPAINLGFSLVKAAKDLYQQRLSAGQRDQLNEVVPQAV